MNLDVEQYLYRPKEQLPGVLTNAIRKIFSWQKREGVGSNQKPFTLDAFTLMFTTQVGPASLPTPYVSYLRDDCIASNLAEFQELTDPFLRKSGGRNAADFFANDFDAAFKLAVPKSLTELKLEQDWYIDDNTGIQVFQFDRAFAAGTYRMLHMAMVVNRQKPPEEQRAPGQKVPAALASHKSAIVKLFGADVISVEALVQGDMEAALRADLQDLFKHRERYYKPPAE